MAIDLDSLRDLYTWMRESGVLHARCGEVELRLEAVAPPLPVPGPPLPDEPEEDEERRSLETLLHSSGVEAEPFLKALRGRRAS